MFPSYISYLQECGFVHSAYTFSHESMLLVGSVVAGNSNTGSSSAVGATSTSAGPFPPQQPQQQQRASWQRVADKTLPPGALISFLQKGLQYVGIEESLLQQQQQELSKKQSKTSEETIVSPANFSLLSPASMHALTRRNPPIVLTVLPAAAAAAVKARLESEASQDSSSLDVLLKQDMAISQTVAMNQEPQPQQQQKQSIVRQQINSTSTVSHTERSRQDEVEGMLGSTNKRSASVPKRSGKKQKISSSMEMVGKANATFTSLEHAMAQLEAAKKQSKLVSVENDSSSNVVTEIRAATTAAHAAESSFTGPLPYQTMALANGEMGDYAIRDNEKQQHGENGSADARGDAVWKTSDGGGSFTSAAYNEEADDDDGDDVVENLYAAKPDEVLKLDKHQSEVFMCAWNPVYTNLIATGSGDASARIWEMNDKYAKAGLKGCTELPHGIETGDKKNKDVTTLEWSTDGLLLATGSYDGIARVWDRTGALIHTLRGHQGPIFSLKWNPRGNFLLSGSYDKTIIVWNLAGVNGADGGGGGDGTANGYIEHQFKDHEAPALDVDWKDDTTFASCSTDRTVHIYKVNIDAPLKVYKGHMDEVNAVKWSPSGKYLASCSDDCTAKVWEVDSDRSEPLYDFVNHDQEIYTVKWSPTGPGSPNPSKMALLATASFDGSIRLWNLYDGSCFGYFNQHRDSVYSVAFSPSGDYLASGSLAGQLYIWDVADSRYVKSYKGKGDIFEVAWNKEETRVAACFSSNVVAVIDFDRTKLPPIPATQRMMIEESPYDAAALIDS